MRADQGGLCRRAMVVRWWGREGTSTTHQCALLVTQHGRVRVKASLVTSGPVFMGFQLRVRIRLHLFVRQHLVGAQPPDRDQRCPAPPPGGHCE